jgi:iron(III) transport system substrate-binding protein
MSRKPSAVLAVCAAAALLLSGCGNKATPAGAGSGAAYCNGASGSITWYTSLEAATTQPVVRDFQAKCGVKVTVQSVGGSFALWQRFQQEQSAGIHKADVISIADWGIAEEAVKGDLVGKLPAGILDGYPAEFKDPEGYWFTGRLLTLGLSYNTSMVSADQVPKSLQELLDPKWKGKIAVLDPRKNAGGYAWGWQVTHTAGLGIEWFQKLVAQDPGVFGQSGQLGNALVSGEYALGITTDDQTWLQIKQGAPLQVTSPSEGSGTNRDQNLLVKSAPNPTGAGAFLGFLASADGGRVLAEQTLDYSPLPGVPAYPSGRTPLSGISLLKADLAQQTADKTQLTATIVATLGLT